MNWAFEHSFRVVSEDLVRFMEKQGSSIYSLPSADGIVLSIAQSEPGCCIAGGAALAIFTGEMDRIKDWDLFFTSDEAYYHTMRVLEAR